MGSGQHLRREDWPRRLDALVAENLHRPMVWGEHDCCLWAATVVDALTGSDIAKTYRGAYANKRQAARMLAGLGGSLDALADRWLPQRPVKYAQRGDVVMIGTDEGPALAVNIGATIAAVSATGLTFYPASAALKAWRV